MRKKAEEIYGKITSYANYSNMNCIEKKWFIDCIEKGLNEVKNIAYEPVLCGDSEQLCLNCKKEPATRGIGEKKIVCSKCWNSIV